MEWLKVLPPLVAIIIVLWKREVILALVLAIFTSEFLLGGTLFEHAVEGSNNIFNQVFTGGLATLDRITAVFADAGNTRILIFSVMVGALLAYMRHSGGVTALVNNLINKGFAKTERQVTLMTTFTGIVVFIESNLSVLTAGILSRGLFDKFGMSRAKLAYIIDSESVATLVYLFDNVCLVRTDVWYARFETIWITVCNWIFNLSFV